MSSPLPDEAKVVIVGGGIIGCSVAYHLTKLGWKDVVLLEQNQLAGGTTWHAAGLVGRLRTSNSLTKINKYSAELYAALEKETGHPIGWKQVGSLIVARSQERMTQLRRTAGMAALFGVQVDLISPQAAQAKWPLIQTRDLVGAAWLPDDGKVIPKETAIALATGARQHGANVLEGVRVLKLLERDGRVAGVRVSASPSNAQPLVAPAPGGEPRGSRKDEALDCHDLRAEHVVLCGGMWARELGLRCGVNLPLHPVEHHYVVTEPIDGAHDELPVGRDPDLCIYFRGEGNAVMLGAFQAESKPWSVPSVPDDFSFQLLESDWEKFAEPLKNGKHRIPALETCRFAKFVNGPESFTPDNSFLMGEAPELRGLFVAAGFNSVGIASAGGAGKYLAEWIIEGQPTIDLWSVDVRRFGTWANNAAFLRERVTEVLGLHYQLAWPNREFETGRQLRKSPLHERLAAAGACFGVKNGWERPNWFARAQTAPAASIQSAAAPSAPPATPPPATEPVVAYSFARQNWFGNHALEHRACRETVALFDQSAFGKLLVSGRDAGTALQRLCGNDVDVPIGKLVYTGLFNERGGFESDLTLLRLARDQFYLITGTAQPVRDADWIRRNLKPSEHAVVADVTNSYGVLGVMGPDSRTLLSTLTDADLSNAAFPFGTAREIDLGAARIRALRITYVGELGWELHIPVEQMGRVYDILLEAGAGESPAGSPSASQASQTSIDPSARTAFSRRGEQPVSPINAGHYAINSLRLEKSYRAWGADISPEDTPIEAGLAFAVAWDKPVAFVGREALLRHREGGVSRVLVSFVLRDPEPMLWGSEPIYRDGKPVGYTTSGSYGHSLGAAVGMGYVNLGAQLALAPRADFLTAGAYEIEVNGSKVPATLHLRAPYDPNRSRVLA